MLHRMQIRKKTVNVAKLMKGKLRVVDTSRWLGPQNHGIYMIPSAYRNSEADFSHDCCSASVVYRLARFATNPRARVRISTWAISLQSLKRTSFSFGSIVKCFLHLALSIVIFPIYLFLDIGTVFPAFGPWFYAISYVFYFLRTSCQVFFFFIFTVPSFILVYRSFNYLFPIYPNTLCLIFFLYLDVFCPAFF